MQFSALGSLKQWKFPKLIFFLDILTIHNDQIPFVMRVLDPLYVFFTLFGCYRGRGGLLNDFVTTSLLEVPC